jgi:hypothetical protein
MPSNTIAAKTGDRRSPWVVVCATLDAQCRATPIDLAGKTVSLSLSRDGLALESSSGAPSIEIEPEGTVEIDTVRGLFRLTDPAKREQSPPSGTIVRFAAGSFPSGFTAADRYEIAAERSGWFAARNLRSGQIVRPTSAGTNVRVVVVGAVAYRPSVAAVDRPGELLGSLEIRDVDGRLSSFPARTGFRVVVG